MKKIGVGLPKSVVEALEIDKKFSNSQWQKTVEK